jgi:hypothetical protein
MRIDYGEQPRIGGNFRRGIKVPDMRRFEEWRASAPSNENLRLDQRWRC